MINNVVIFATIHNSFDVEIMFRNAIVFHDTVITKLITSICLN